MNSLDTCCVLFETISNNRSRIQKEALLRSTIGTAEEATAKELFSLVLDPARLTGIGTLHESDYPQEGLELGHPYLVRLLKSLEDGQLDRTELGHALNRMPPLTRKWVSRAIIKDLRMGVSYGLVERVWPGLVAYFECQLATTVEDIEAILYPVLAEAKIDDVRSIAVVRDYKVTFLSREGKPLYNTGEQETALAEFCYERGYENCYVDGGMFAGSWNKTMKVVRRSKSDPDPDLLEALKFFVFDWLTEEEWHAGRSDVPYIVRRSRFEGLPAFNACGECISKLMLIPYSVITNPHHLEKAFKAAIAASRPDRVVEGIMIKAPSAPYEKGRNCNWLRRKGVETGDFEVVDVYEGSNRHVGRLGGLVVRVDGNVLCNVGGGFSDTQRDDYWREPPIGKIVEIQYKYKTPEGRLREPVFKHIRDDKEGSDG